jgi:hypothetical protein
MTDEFMQVVAGSSVTNMLFLIGLGILNYFRKRLNKSNCQSHCYIFDCEAQLTELQTVKDQVTTQRGMLQNVLEILDKSSSKSTTQPLDIV